MVNVAGARVKCHGRLPSQTIIQPTHVWYREGAIVHFAYVVQTFPRVGGQTDDLALDQQRGFSLDDIPLRQNDGKKIQGQ